jgi:hypothetical protein
MNTQKSCFEYFSKISWGLNTGANIPFFVFEAGTRLYLEEFLDVCKQLQTCSVHVHLINTKYQL